MIKLNSYMKILFYIIITIFYWKTLTIELLSIMDIPLQGFVGAVKVTIYTIEILTSLFKKFSLKSKLRIADIGCGYAELLNYFYQCKMNSSMKAMTLTKIWSHFVKKI